VNATGSSSFQLSNLIAGLGGSWDYAPMGHTDEFINVPVPHVNFRDMMSAALSNGQTVFLETIMR
jgi:hypothetical protein